MTGQQVERDKLLLFVLLSIFYCGCSRPVGLPETSGKIADKNTYLENIHQDLVKKWPNNRTITIVCHGHSVPAGYFNTPSVKPFDSYPHLLYRALNDKYPHAVINVIVTAIGGEHSESGGRRFDQVLAHRPDVLFIDYALNDRNIGLQRANRAWSVMIEQALQHDIKVILLTPTLDVTHVPGNAAEPLNQHADQIRLLAEKYHVGLVDSLEVFDEALRNGAKNTDFLSNGFNHPDRKGHQLVTEKIMEWF